MNSSVWMANPNVRFIITVMVAAMPAIIADLSNDKLSWLTLGIVISNMLIAAKAFMSDPNS